MKRVFVPNRFQGSGIGRRLFNVLIASARDVGFPLMRLDTGKITHEALSLYQSLGFRECTPYYEYPSNLMPYLVFMEMSLVNSVVN